MSSDSVTTGSSKLRQFGLYRTIDSRTEEFLKLSRRRQIRQGCACAAVSTAITVTVVVIVLLIYEYGFRVEYEMPPKSKHKSKWISMLNDSDSGFDQKHHKSNFNIDRNTLKLLPLILKAIKQNKYLEKVIDDNSSQPPNDRHTTEFPIQRNVFTDARNWIRMPASRMYAIEYKTSPIVFFKSRNLETFAKARKMMESQRIMNYLDKMLSEKVNPGSTNPVKGGESSSTIKTTTVSGEIPGNTYLQYINPDRVRELIMPPRRIEPVTERQESASCNCPGNLKEILTKLAHNIEQLLPENGERKSDVLKPCNKSKTTTTTQSVVTTKKFQKKSNKFEKMNGVTLIKDRNQPKIFNSEPKLETNKPADKLVIAQNMIANIPNLQRRVPHKDLSDIVIASYKKKHTGSKESDPDPTTTVKWNIEPTEYFIFDSITTSRPMTSKPIHFKHVTSKPMTSTSSSFKPITSKSTTSKPAATKPITTVTTTKFWHITSEETEVIAHQFNEDIFSGAKDYYKKFKLAYVTTTSTPTTEFSFDKTIEELKSKSKKMTLKQFLLSQKENLSKSSSQKKPFKGTLPDDYKAEIPEPELPAIKTFNAKRDDNQEQKGPHAKVDSSTAETLLNNEISNVHVGNNTKTRSVESLLSITDEDFENILPGLVETDAILLNDTALAESLRNLGISSQEVSYSLLPQIRPSFLEIRRNEGRHEETDYDPDTLNNLNVYD